MTHNPTFVNSLTTRRLAPTLHQDQNNATGHGTRRDASTATVIYAYTGGDSADVTLTADQRLVSRSISLPGGSSTPCPVPVRPPGITRRCAVWDRRHWKKNDLQQKGPG
jgi:hypothetical protein